MIPAIMTGTMFLTIRSGRRTPMAEIPTPDFAVPYAAPKHVKTMADVQPMAPKKGAYTGQRSVAIFDEDSGFVELLASFSIRL